MTARSVDPRLLRQMAGATRARTASPAGSVGAVRACGAFDWIAVGLATMAVMAIFMVSPELLTLLKVHYISPGGGFYEKLHPATYLAFAAFAVLLLRDGNPVGTFNRMMAEAKLLLVFFFTCALLMFQCVALGRPFTGVIDTFLLPALLALTLWNLPRGGRAAPVVALHTVIWINIALAFYEYVVGHRLIPITVGKLLVTGDWRSTALLGHPLSAAGMVTMYSMTLMLGRGGRGRGLWRVAAVSVAICSLMVFGGRTALVAVMVVLAGLGIMQMARLVRGERVGMPAVIMGAGGIMVAAAAVPVLLGSGIFDNMIDRFSSDNGSAHARIAMFHFVSLFSWDQLLLGSSPGYASALQSMVGIDYGIENFWIASTVQYGLIQTVLITIGLGCFFAEVLKRASPGARVGLLFIVVIAAGSVSFSSKNITLAAYVTLIVLLLPRLNVTPAGPVRWPRGGVPHRTCAPVMVARRQKDGR